MPIRIAIRWPLLVLAAFLIAFGGVARVDAHDRMQVVMPTRNHTPSDDGCREFGGRNSKCS